MRLETKGNYPHNGLAGIAFDPIGWMFFGFGENLGEPYKIIGSDGTTLSGGGEGGNVYRCRLDGSKLERWATGFWNPHASCFDAFGRLFTVDNDADSRPPCRLLHIIPGGDYGFRFRNGRKGLHPFTAWNGEIPGTLPMVAGTGEAPSGILAYESDGLPEEYLGNLLVTSWGDHRIDRFRLKPKGASFESLAEPVIVGGENFRPVGIACAPDGSLFVSDWVLRDYKLHGKGRVWKVSRAGSPLRELDLAAADLRIRRQMARGLTDTADGRRVLLAKLADPMTPKRARLECLWSLALVPVDVEDFDFMRLRGGLCRIPGPFDEVAVAAYDLAESPQFPVRFPALFLFKKENQFAGTDHKSQPFADVLPLSLFCELPHIHLNKFGGFSLVAAIDSGDPFLLSRLVSSQAEPERSSVEHPLNAERLVQLVEFGSLMNKNSASSQRVNVAKPFSSSAHSVAWLLVARAAMPRNQSAIEWGLRDESLVVRRAAVQWVAEEGLKEFRPQVAAILNDPGITSDLFLATLAALEMLDGVPPQEFDKTPASKYVVPLLKDANRPPAVRVQALRLASPADPALDAKLLKQLLTSDDFTLRLETLRTLQFSPLEEAGEMLAGVALSPSPWKGPIVADRDQYEKVKQAHDAHRLLISEAILSLASVANRNPPDHASSKVLRRLLNTSLEVRTEVIRSLRQLAQKDESTRSAILESVSRGTGNPLWWEDIDQHLYLAFPAGSREADVKLKAWESRPQSAEGWKKVLASRESDYDKLRTTTGIEAAASGRRVFYHPNGAGCFKCHTVNGRGGNVGPDLSTVARSMSHDKLIESILEPSREVAPQFTTWTMETADGKVHSGMIVHENEGKTILGDAEGKLTELKTIDIVGRTPQRQSVMPDKLSDRLTVQEFRDLLAFLESLK